MNSSRPKSPSSRDPVRLLHVVSHPIQYFAPLYRELTSRPEIDLTVLFCSDLGLNNEVDPGFGINLRWDIPLLDGYRYRLLRGSGKPGRSNSLVGLPNWNVFLTVLGQPFDVLWVHGYTLPNSVLAILAARLRRRPVLLRDDATLLDARSAVRSALKRGILPIFMRRVYGLYLGSRNREFFRHYGVPDRRLFFTPHSVDNGLFQAQSAELLPRKHLLSRSFGLASGLPVILFCGKLTSKKDPLTLLRAFKEVTRNIECALLFAGDGPLRAELEEFVARAKVPNVCFSGFLNQSEISRAYAVADVLVLPSVRRETWGLVVNEAMNFGLPVIVSDKVGCAVDLIRPGENGDIVPAGSSAALANAIAALLQDSQRRQILGTRSHELIEAWDIGCTADGILKAVRAAMADKRQQAYELES